VFYRTLGGAEVVRDWLRPPSRGPRPHARSIPLARWYAALPVAGRRLVVRTSLPSNRIARVLFSVQQGRILVLHGFIKKTQKTPPDDLALARRRNREFKK